MLDFVKVGFYTPSNSKKLYISPEFAIKRPRDLMIKGKSFYAIWDEEAGLWSKDEYDVQRMVDKMVYDYAEKCNMDNVQLKLMSNFSSNKWNQWIKYCKSLPDNYKELDSKIIFANQKINKTDYATRQLNYPLEECPTPAYDEIMSILYDPSEREKLEWAIGAIITGDSKNIQKFMVLYGGPGTGKGTVIRIIEMLFDGYCGYFDSKSLGSRSSEFALEDFKDNPLIAIDPDGNISRLEDNTKLNTIVSHETMTVNEKFKSKYLQRFHSFIFIGSNNPVKITDAKSGLLRRLIDVSPTGNTIPPKRYDELMEQVKFELPGIAYHCLGVYEKMGSKYYNSYVPLSMMSTTNDMYSFMEDNYLFFTEECKDGVGLNTIWLRYKEYCEDSMVQYPMSKRVFKSELKNYFETFKERTSNTTNWYEGFLTSKFKFGSDPKEEAEEVKEGWLKFNKSNSIFDDVFKDCPAQYSNEDGKPNLKWDNVKTTLADMDTKKEHFTKLPKQIINIDFDLKDEEGNKSLELNMAAASKFPPTYAELSKSGCGIHLTYEYVGDTGDLSNLYDKDIEIKKSVGNSSLRRRLTKCNNLPIAKINSGLPLKERRNVTSEQTIKDEKHLRNLIIKGLKKEVFPNTKPSIDFIYKILDDAYKSGMKYDVSDMAPDIQQFAMSSSHQTQLCLKMVSKMKFSSEEPSDNLTGKMEGPIIFYDIEVFPNLFIICWKKQGSDRTVKMINPTATQVEEFIRGAKLVGFNNRRYDNHILWAGMMGYTNEQLFKLSQRIVNDNDRNALFGEAYNLSYTDVYDFLSSANKMSLKKWEIKLHIHHLENAYAWDQPVDPKYWDEIADYCCNDVRATEAVWNANQSDWEAREMLAELSGLSVNDTTNQHTTRIIVGNDKKPQSQFIYTDLSTIFPGYKFNSTGINPSEYNEGTKIVTGKSIYKGKDPGEGGYAIGYPGIYYNVALLDVESMHPHSAIKLKIFGETYTARFEEIVAARLAIKHGDYDAAGKMLGGKLKPYLKDPKQAKKVANALKTAINSVYGLTSASFDNKLRDPRNKDNIVAKYGALFMINLEEEVTKRGYKVVHIKTDSIKIADATPEIIDFCMGYARDYGFKFEHEATYEKMCILNDAVYVAKYADGEHEFELPTGEKIMTKWTATGKQFQVPFVFKTLFSHTPINFYDMCETFSTTSALYLDMGTEDNHDYRFVGKVGEFTPIKPGCGGGVLLREQDGKYHAATGTKKQGKIPKGEDDRYYWLESETVKITHKEDDIDQSYYRYLVDNAIEAISNFGDYEQFVD